MPRGSGTCKFGRAEFLVVRRYVVALVDASSAERNLWLFAVMLCFSGCMFGGAEFLVVSWYVVL